MANGHLLWERDGLVVSYAAAGAPINGMPRAGPVYTPPEHRGRGIYQRIGYRPVYDSTELEFHK